MIRWRRWLTPTMLALTLSLNGALAPTAALAQEAPPAEGEESEGRPADGYIATTFLAALAMFLVCKSARRS